MEKLTIEELIETDINKIEKAICSSSLIEKKNTINEIINSWSSNIQGIEKCQISFFEERYGDEVKYNNKLEALKTKIYAFVSQRVENNDKNNSTIINCISITQINNQSIEKILNSFSDEQLDESSKKELKELIRDFSEVKTKDDKKIRFSKILKFLAGKSVDIAIAILPIILSSL